MPFEPPRTLSPLQDRLSRRNTQGVIFRLVPLLSCGILLVAQSRSEWQSCPVIAKMPAEMRAMEPLDQRQRFELRQCRGENVVRRSNDAVVVSVPATMYPGLDNKSVPTPAPKEYSFSLDH